MKAKERGCQRFDRSAPLLRRDRARLVLLSGLLALFVLRLVLQLVDVQLLSYQAYRELALNQQEQEYRLPARRGEISDRRGGALAVSEEVHRLYAIRHVIKDVEKTGKSLGEVLNLPAASVGARLRGTGFTYLGREVGIGVVRQVEALHLPGIGVETRYGRFYPHGDLLAPLLGRVDPSGRGLGGLEYQYDGLLAGEEGWAILRKDGRGNSYPDLTLPHRKPRHGQSLRLTIDLEVQEIAETVLGETISRTGASGGSMIILDPRTGELLAAANRPTRNLNEGGEIPRNRAFLDVYEPGSTFKVVTLSAVYEEELAYPEEMVYAEGGQYRVAGRVIKESEAFEWLTVKEAIQHSSNIAMVKLAERLGRARQYDYIRRFGFGTPTGIPFPGEPSGILRPLNQWSALSSASLAMGYEVAVTPLQMAMAFAVVANGGLLLEPRLVMATASPDGEPVERSSLQVVRRVMSPPMAKAVREALVGVVEGGTGVQARVGHHLVGGKTGTAVKVDPALGYRSGRYIASFAGFLPVEEPRWVVFVVLDEPQNGYYGGATAAPAFRQVILEAMVTEGSLFGPWVEQWIGARVPSNGSGTASAIWTAGGL